MTTSVKIFLVVMCAAILNISAYAQTSERRQTSSTPQAHEQAPNLQANGNSNETVASEIALLRKSLQALNTRLREINERLSAPDQKQSDPLKDQQNHIALGLELLGRAEQRAEVMRRQLLELIEKETAYKSRLVQIEEDMRPESIERSSSLMGSTRTAEIRDVRRRVLDNDRRGYESLLIQTSQSRIRLEDDVKQADALVSKLRQRVLPMIDKEIEKINPN